MNLPLSLGAGGGGLARLLPASEHPMPDLMDRLAHEYALKDELDGRSAMSIA